jgi:hypothetical protein
MEAAQTENPPAWDAGDNGNSHGPMQVERGGAIDAFEQAHSVSVDDSTLDDASGPGASQAVQIGCWYLAQCIANANGVNPTAFSNYNAGVGTYTFPNTSNYGTSAYAYYQQIGGKA